MHILIVYRAVGNNMVMNLAQNTIEPPYYNPDISQRNPENRDKATTVHLTAIGICFNMHKRVYACQPIRLLR